MTAKQDDHFSYSQLRQYETCPYAYFLSRYCGVETKTSSFAQAGNLMHSLLAQWARGEIPARDLPHTFCQEYPKQVTEPFPKYLGSDYSQKLFDQYLAYLQTFNGFSGLEVVAVEKRLQTEIAGEKFVGIIDLILKNEKDELFLMDHKSSSKITKDMYKQLYLYSKLTTETYGHPPTVLLFNQFKTGKVNVQMFSQEKYLESLSWAEKVIHMIRDADMNDWLSAKKEAFYCGNLCECREICSLSNAA